MKFENFDCLIDTFASGCRKIIVLNQSSYLFKIDCTPTDRLTSVDEVSAKVHTIREIWCAIWQDETCAGDRGG